MFDLIHPDDVEKVREQLSTTESQNTGRILDLKSKFSLNFLSQLCVVAKFGIFFTRSTGNKIFFLLKIMKYLLRIFNGNLMGSHEADDFFSISWAII